MALRSIVFSKDGSAWLNSLKRFCLSAVVVPTQQNTIVKIPAGTSTQPGRSRPIPLQGPKDASTELYSFTGKQAIKNQGIGVITTTGADTNVVGVGTKFLTQLQAGDTIFTTAGSATVATVTSDTTATTTGNMAAGASLNYFFSTTQSQSTSGTLFVSVQDQAWRRRLMNRDVPILHFFGTNTQPEFLKESILLETDQTLLMEFLNYGTAAASFAPIAEGRKWQYAALKYKEVYDFIGGLRERKQYIQPYWLTLDNGWNALGATAGTSGTSFLTCTGDITLVLFNCYGTAIRDSNGSDITANGITVQFTDAKTMRTMQSQPVPLNLCSGSAAQPYRLPSPWIVEPQTQLKVDFVNNTGLACKVYMTFQGVAIYTGSSMHGSTLTNEQLRREAAQMYEALSTPQIRGAEAQG